MMRAFQSALIPFERAIQGEKETTVYLSTAESLSWMAVMKMGGGLLAEGR